MKNFLRLLLAAPLLLTAYGSYEDEDYDDESSTDRFQAEVYHYEHEDIDLNKEANWPSKNQDPLVDALMR
jgi:hypothetical protein